MGLFDSVRKAFDAGGIKVGLDVPKSFTWSDAAIPVTVTLTGHKTEPRTVTALSFELEEDDVDRSPAGTGSRVSTGRGPVLRHREAVTVDLAPGETSTVEVQVALHPDAAVTDAAGWVGKAVEVVAALGTITLSADWYKLSVHTTVEGAAASKGASRRIRNGNASVTASFSIG